MVVCDSRSVVGVLNHSVITIDKHIRGRGYTHRFLIPFKADEQIIPVFSQCLLISHADEYTHQMDVFASREVSRINNSNFSKHWKLNWGQTLYDYSSVAEVTPAAVLRFCMCVCVCVPLIT